MTEFPSTGILMLEAEVLKEFPVGGYHQRPI